MSISFALILIGLLAIVSLAMVGGGMTIVNIVKYKKLRKCYAGTLIEEPMKLLFASKQEVYVESDKVYAECNKLDCDVKDKIIALFRRYRKILLIMQLICMCLIILIVPSISLMLGNYRTAGNVIFLIPYAIFILTIMVVLGVVRKKVAMIMAWMQNDSRGRLAV